MADYQVIYDAVAWVEGDDNDVYRTMPRGTVFAEGDVPAGKVAEWTDADRHPPHGAVAKVGSKLAAALASSPSVAEDPVDTRRRLAAAAGAEAQFLDPAQEPADVPSTRVESDVLRAMAGDPGTSTARATGEGSGAHLNDMSDKDLRAVAKGLEIEGAQRLKGDDLREAIRARVMSGPPAAEPPAKG